MINIIQIIKNKKSIKEEIGELDDNLVNLRKDLKKMKKETLKNMYKIYICQIFLYTIICQNNSSMFFLNKNYQIKKNLFCIF